VKKPEEAMEILEAYDATGSLRGAAALAGCDHKTVARLVAVRDVAGGGLPERARSRPLVDPFAVKIDELVDRSRALVRADVVHGVLVAMGYEGSYRTTRRAVAEAKRRWRNKHCGVSGFATERSHFSTQRRGLWGGGLLGGSERAPRRPPCRVPPASVPAGDILTQPPSNPRSREGRRRSVLDAIVMTCWLDSA
jgi:hypothetical protein